MNNKKIILYTKSNCPMCNVLKNKLKSCNIEYELCEDIELMISKGFKGTPVLEVDGQTFTLKDAMKWAEENKCQ